MGPEAGSFVRLCQLYFTAESQLLESQRDLLPKKIFENKNVKVMEI